jgi:hypothetical protein
MNNYEFIEYLQTKYNHAERTLQDKERHIRQWNNLCIKNQKLEKLITKRITEPYKQTKRKNIK